MHLIHVAGLQVLRFFAIFEGGKRKTPNPSLGPYVSKCDNTLQLDTWESVFMGPVLPCRLPT